MGQPMRLLVVCLVVFFAALAPAEELPPLEESFGRGVLVIDAEDACHRFHIYLALTRDQQRRGLMFVRELAPNAGMLFVYREPAYLSMWMKNTFIPLATYWRSTPGRRRDSESYPAAGFTWTQTSTSASNAGGTGQ